jgi:hypothetical protein
MSSALNRRLPNGMKSRYRCDAGRNSFDPELFDVISGFEALS